jgi:hypothetical protein
VAFKESIVIVNVPMGFDQHDAVLLNALGYEHEEHTETWRDGLVYSYEVWARGGDFVTVVGEEIVHYGSDEDFGSI